MSKRFLRLKIQKMEKINKTWVKSFFEDYKLFEGDRKFSPGHAEDLGLQMDEGKFVWDFVNVILCTLGEDEYRLNTKHTIAAMQKRGLDDGSISFRVFRYEAGTMEDLRDLYNRIDRGKARSFADQVHAQTVGVEAFETTASSTIRMLAQGMRMWLCESPSAFKKMDGDATAVLLKTHQLALAKEVLAFWDSMPTTMNSTPHVDRIAVAAAMFATFDANPARSKTFWEPIWTGLNMTELTDPRLVIHNILRTTTNQREGTHVRRRGFIHVCPREHLLRMCLYAWNAYMNGTPVKTKWIDPKEHLDRPVPLREVKSP